MRTLSGYLEWLRARNNFQSQIEIDHFSVEDIAHRLCDQYRILVEDKCARGGLAEVITALAGCLLTQSFTGAAAFEPNPDEDGWTVPATDRLAGLLLLEVALAAAEGFRPPTPELSGVSPELLSLAEAYESWPSSDDANEVLAQHLYALGCAVGERTKSAAGESLMPLARAHGFVTATESGATS